MSALLPRVTVAKRLACRIFRERHIGSEFWELESLKSLPKRPCAFFSKVHEEKGFFLGAQAGEMHTLSKTIYNLMFLGFSVLSPEGQVRKFEPFICLAKSDCWRNKSDFYSQRTVSVRKTRLKPSAEKCTVCKSLYTLLLSSKGIYSFLQTFKVISYTLSFWNHLIILLKCSFKIFWISVRCWVSERQGGHDFIDIWVWNVIIFTLINLISKKNTIKCLAISCKIVS